MPGSTKRIFTRDPLPEDHYLNVGGIKTRYWAVGSGGPSVVLVHGLGASAEIWMYNISALARRHRLYIPDLVGFGLTDKPDVVYTPAYMTGFLNDFIETLSMDNISLVGMSLGGGLALNFALQSPGRVQKLVLVSSAGLSREISLLMRLATLPFLGEVMVRPSRAGIAFLLKRCVHDPTVITDDLVELYYRYTCLPGATRAILSILRASASIFGGRRDILDPITQNLHTIKLPTLIIWGREDRILPLSHASIAQERIPECRLEIFDACGHIPNIEKPDEFNSLVLRFLSEGLS